jgi:hypothetical protein
MKLYVYCVTDQKPPFPLTLVGLADKEVEFLSFKGLFVVTSKFDGDVVTVNRENVLRHDAVIREVFSQVTVLPFRFGTLLTEAKLESYLGSKYHVLLERISTLRNSIEMSVKIIWKNPPEKESAQERSNLEQGQGTAFLQSKREKLLVDEKLDREAHSVSEWVKSQLAGLVQTEQVSIQPKQKLVLSASYLVDRGNEAHFREILNKLRSERPELHFLISGPWPPYTFANIELEFDAQFGVS